MYKDILQYQKTGDEDLGNKLLDQHRSIINKHVSKWSGVLPDVVIKKHADILALNAFKTFNPEKSNINTQLFNHLSQLSRIVYTHQNVAKIPEHQILQIKNYQNAVNHLSDSLGYQPSLDEVADYMAMPVSHIERLSKNLRKDYTYDGDAEDAQQGLIQDSKNSLYLQDTFSRLDDKQQEMFKNLTGYKGSKVLKPSEFGKKFNMKPYEVSRVKSNLAKKFGV